MELLGKEYLRKFLGLPALEQWLLIKAVLLLEAIKLGMRLLPFRTCRRLVSLLACTPVKPRDADHLSAERIAWAVKATSQRTPGVKSCLVQALATQALLIHRGHPALLHIGVVRGERDQFRAHAWVVTDGKAVIGGSELGGYVPLAVLE